MVENSQRVDVHPYEEAQGFRRLLDMPGYDVSELAAKSGKSASHIYARLSLLLLNPTVAEAFREERINASHANLIARLPQEHQADAFENCWRKDWQPSRSLFMFLAQALAIQARVDQIERESVLTKIDLLFSLCTPPVDYAPLNNYAYDRARLEKIDGERHAVIHGNGFVTLLPTIEEDLDYISKSAWFVMGLVNQKHQPECDQSACHAERAAERPGRGDADGSDCASQPHGANACAVGAACKGWGVEWMHRKGPDFDIFFISNREFLPVTNTWINCLLADDRKPLNLRSTFPTGKGFSGWPDAPSLAGLLGPVQIITAVLAHPNGEGKAA